METLVYNSTSLTKVILSQYGQNLSLPATPVALLVHGIDISPYSHRFKRALSALKYW